MSNCFEENISNGDDHQWFLFQLQQRLYIFVLKSSHRHCAQSKGYTLRVNVLGAVPHLQMDEAEAPRSKTTLTVNTFAPLCHRSNNSETSLSSSIRLLFLSAFSSRFCIFCSIVFFNNTSKSISRNLKNNMGSSSNLAPIP